MQKSLAVLPTFSIVRGIVEAVDQADLLRPGTLISIDFGLTWDTRQQPDMGLFVPCLSLVGLSPCTVLQTRESAMGFLQNLLSLRSRRSKKHRTRMEVDTYGTPPILDLRQQHDDQEATVNRLLRSSSARFAIMREVDYASLPPLRECNFAMNEPFGLIYRSVAHPIHNVLPTPTVSTSSLPIVSQRGTYTVRILSRTLHSRTEFPNANPDESITPNRLPHDSSRRRSKSVPITPRDKTRLLGLRQDPSVASLLNLYDEHGCLNSKVFSNSPTSPDTGPDNEGRSQLRRGGSTLRQLLGGPSSLSARHARGTSAAEGDISWAERYLWYGCVSVVV